MKQQGFTLVELMTTIAIGALLVSLAVPGVRSLTLTSKLTLPPFQDTSNSVRSKEPGL